MNDNNNVTKQTRRPSASPPALNLEEDTEENMDKSITNDAKEGSNKSRSWSWHWGWGEVNPHRRKTPHGKGLEKLEMTALDVLNAEEKDGKANATKDSNNEDDDDDEQFNTARQLLRPTSTKKRKQMIIIIVSKISHQMNLEKKQQLLIYFKKTVSTTTTTTTMILAILLPITIKMIYHLLNR